MIKSLEKGDFERVKKKVDKNLEKEALNVEAAYLLTLYYADKRNTGAYQLDSAYKFVRVGLGLFDQLDTETKTEFAEDGFTNETLTTVKERIESTAFSQADSLYTEESFRDFVLRFPEAQQLKEAKSLRDSLAFVQAEQEDTYQSYQQFIDKYPDAVQKPDAEKRYDKLLYTDKTRLGSKSAYADFIRDYPNSPFKSEADRKLFDLLTFDHKEESYQEYVRQFPDYAYAALAWEFLWYKYTDKKAFFKFYPDSPAKYKKLATVDSLKYYPYYSAESETFGFFDHKGVMQVKPSAVKIPEDYLCEGVQEDYIIFSDGTKQGTYNKIGEQCLRVEYDAIEPFSQDILRVRIGDKWGLIHKSGFEMMPCKYNKIEPLTEGLVKVSNNKKWGVSTCYDRLLLPEDHDYIESTQGTIFILKSGNKVGVIKESDLLYAENSITVQYPYDDAEKIKRGFIEVEKQEQVSVLNALGEVVIPFTDEIIETEEGWLVYKDSTVTILDHFGNRINENVFEKAIEGPSYYAVKQKGQWGVMNFDGVVFIDVTYDTLSFLGKKGILLEKGDEKLGYFDGEQLVPLSKYNRIKVEVGRKLEGEVYREVPYIIAEAKNRKMQLLSENGEIILKPRYNDINIINEELVMVKSGSKRGLFDLAGKRVVSEEYDGIASNAPGLYSIFKQEKFGLYHHWKGVTIPPSYDVLLKPYGNSDSVFIAKKGNYGLIDIQDEPIVDFEYDELKYWNDSVALVHHSGKWKLLNIKGKYFLPEVFESFRLVKETDDETVLITYRSTGYGVLSNKRGRIIIEEFSDIINLGTVEEPIYFVERSISQVGLYVILYFDKDGKLLKENILRERAYQNIVCPE
ncbi:WG repeat-containing protein [Limibacter armeniacum]|uniref:WG repeat-containing protein n=1 Tax=Limibacter armeniacum TaxID=466084 RepID=UPI002FE57C70